MKFLLRTPFIIFILVPLLVGQPVWGQLPVATPIDETSSGAGLQLHVINAEGSRVTAGSRTTRGFTVQVTNASGTGVSEAAVAIRLPDSDSSGTFPDGSHSAVVYTDATGNAHVDVIQWSQTPGTAAIRVTASKGDEHAGALIEQTLVPPGTSLPAISTEPVISVASTAPSNRITAAVVAPEPAVVRQPGIPSSIPSVSVSSLDRNSRSMLSSPSSSVVSPSVSVMSSSQEKFSSGGGSMKKWIILGVVIAAGAGAGFAFASKGKSSSTASTSSSISFGSPTISVGQP